MASPQSSAQWLIRFLPGLHLCRLPFRWNLDLALPRSSLQFVGSVLATLALIEPVPLWLQKPEMVAEHLLQQWPQALPELALLTGYAPEAGFALGAGRLTGFGNHSQPAERKTRQYPCPATYDAGVC
jgi:hypothetical protein